MTDKPESGTTLDPGMAAQDVVLYVKLMRTKDGDKLRVYRNDGLTREQLIAVRDAILGDINIQLGTLYEEQMVDKEKMN